MPNSIVLTLDEPDVNLCKATESDRYDLVFTSANTQITIKLSQSALKALPGFADTALPGLDAKPMPEDDALWRCKAEVLKGLPDHSMQMLLRELDSTALLYVLWFVKDKQLAQTVMNNLSRRAAAMLLDELAAKFYGRDPHTASEQDKNLARQSLQGVLGVLQRLTEEGQIAQVNV